MLTLALSSARKLTLASAAAALLTLASLPSQAQPDPPSQAGRVSYVSGDVSIQPVNSDNWGQAEQNFPLGPGDRIFTDANGRAEVQIGQTFLRIGPNSDVSLIDSTPAGLYFGVAGGSVHVHTLGLWQGQSVYVNTPSGNATLSTPGDLRVDVLTDQFASIFTSFWSNALISAAGGFSQYIGDGQAFELAGSNPVVPQWLQPADQDALDNWNHMRDQLMTQSAAYQYVSPEIPGAYEMNAAGTWMPGTEYGAIWFPNNVSGDWAPYHNGHWVNHAPWGWVWVEDESWGYAPFHYGRWVSFQGRWGWIPGPPAAHPVWSPALVVFAGGIHVGGVGVSAWFPLGPGEPYRPWYPCSPRYTDQVNISNISESRRVHVQTTYVNINVVNITYVNRTTAVTAMRQEDFASGRGARQANVVVDVHQMDHVQPLAAPEARPTAQSFTGRPPTRPVPVSTARPVLINQQGMSVSARPGAQPVAPPVRQAPTPRPVPGHTIIAPPAGATRPPNVPMRPEAHPVPPPAAPAKPAPVAVPAAAPPVVSRPQPPATPAPARPLPPPPPQRTPPSPAVNTPAQPSVKPPAPQVTKPAPAPPPPPAAPNAAKPGSAPPAKTDKEKDKNKEKPKENPSGV